VIVGDGAVGKTSMLATFASGVFPTDYVPTVFDNRTVSVAVDGKTQDLCLIDTAGQEDFDRLRALFYPDASCFVVCFSVVDVDSAYSVKERWLAELQLYAPSVPIVLVATKVDLRDDVHVLSELKKQATLPVTRQQGEMLAADVKAYAYFETSAAKNTGLQPVFEEAARLAVCHKRGKKPPKQLKVHAYPLQTANVPPLTRKSDSLASPSIPSPSVSANPSSSSSPPPPPASSAPRNSTTGSRSSSDSSCCSIL